MGKQLSILFFVLALLISFLSAYNVISNYHTQERIQHFLAQLRITQIADQLVHALQRERGWSSVVLSQNSENINTELNDLSKKTDEFSEMLRYHVSQSTNQSQSNNIYARSQKILDKLENLSEVRSEIRNQKISPENTYHFFTKLIEYFDPLTGALSESSASAIIANFIVPYTGIKKMKEHIGQERAVGGIILSRGSASNELKALIKKLHTEQDAYASITTIYAGRLQEAVHESIASSGSRIELDILRKKLLSEIDNRNVTTIPAEQWLIATTDYIDTLGDLENKLSNQIITASEADLLEARTWMAISLAIFLFSVSFSIFAWRKLHAFSSSVLALTDTTARLSQGNHEAEIPQYNHTDEVGNMIQSLQVLKERELERIKALNELSENREKLDAIFNEAATPMISISTKGIIESVNAALLRLYGYTENEMLGKNVKMIVPEPHRSQHDSYLSNFVSSGRNDIFGTKRKLISIKKSGEKFPVLLTVNSARANDETIFIGAIEDQTEFDKARELLELEKLKLEDESWLKTNYSTLISQIQGCEQVEDLARTLITTLTPVCKAGVGAYYQREKGTTGDNDELVLYGSYGFEMRKGVSNRYQIGERLVGQCALEKKRITISGIPDDYIRIGSALGDAPPKEISAIPMIYDHETIAVIELASFNGFDEQHKRLFDQLESNIGVFVNNILSRKRTQILLMESQQQSEELQAQQEELRVTNEELEHQAKILKDSKLDLQQKQEELEQKNSDLEDSSAALVHQQNELARKANELQQASRYKSEFLSNMSHELRTPLNSMLILSKSLLGNHTGNLTKDQLDDMEIIYKGGNDLLNLINDILDLSKVEAGKLDIECTEVSVKDVLQRMKDQFTHVAKNKALDFFIDSDLPENAYFFSDQQRIEQILKNLLSNAIKFTSAGSITLRCYEPEDSDSYSINKPIALEVKDTGIGISSENQNAIFEAFQQEDGSTSRKYGGTGLGLTITRKLANLLGGTIELESQQGKGSVFRVIIPKQLESGHTSQQSVTNDLPPTENPVHTETPKTNNSEPAKEYREDDNTLKAAHHPHLTILVVEDDPTFEKVMESTILRTGHTCITAADGEQALELTRSASPDIILLDLGIPKMDGIELLDQLKHENLLENTKVYVISGSNRSREAIEKGALGYLHKPVSQEQLDQIFSTTEQSTSSIQRKLLVLCEENELDSFKSELHDLCESSTILFSHSVDDAISEIDKHSFDGVIFNYNSFSLYADTLLNAMNNGALPFLVYSDAELMDDEISEITKLSNAVLFNEDKSSQADIESALTSILSQNERSDTTVQKDTIAPRFEKRKVLIVDDDLRTSFSMSKALKTEGIEVVIADNGQLAVDKVKSDTSIDLILMDIMMPVMDGFEATRKIRSLPHCKSLPIIALTAKTMDEDRKNSIDAGASDFATKPVDINAILSLMEVWLSDDE